MAGSVNALHGMHGPPNTGRVLTVVYPPAGVRCLVLTELGG